MTQKELADTLGVSQMTVSRALRRHPHVDERLRARILQAAARHGYSAEANHAAEVMRRRARGEEAVDDGNEDERREGLDQQAAIGAR